SPRNQCSKLKPSFTRALGERLDATVIQIAAAVEHDALHAQLLRRVGELLAHLGRLLCLVAFERFRQADPRGGGKRLARVVVDELGEDAAVRAEDRQARTLRVAADLAAHAAMPALTQLANGDLAHARFPTFLRTYSPS